MNLSDKELLAGLSQSGIDPLVTFSIVSHGQGQLVAGLLRDFRYLDYFNYEIFLTLNIPEDESVFQEFLGLPIKIIRNDRALGFGANHNQACSVSHGDVFVVVNPDIRLRDFSLLPILEALARENVGACAPIVLSKIGNVEDSVRRFPSIAQLMKRVVLRSRESDYGSPTEITEVEWAAGMFIAFKRAAYQSVCGFDERFFMYVEDADICRRLGRHGWRTVLQPRTCVIHDARRASRKRLRHLFWHVRSLLRFLFL